MAVRLLYLLIFLFVGGLGNFFALWLESLGWSDAAIGWLEAAKYATAIAFPVIWGRVADRTGRPVRTLVAISWCTALAFLPMALTTRVVAVFASMVAFGAFRAGIIPIIDSITVAWAERNGDEYGRIRLWGSWGFIVGGFLVGGLVTVHGRGIVPAALVAILVVAALATGLLPRQPVAASAAPPTRSAFRTLWSAPGLRGFLLVAFLWRLSGQGLYSFLPLHLNDLGVADGAIPVFWSIGVFSEIVLLRYAPRLFGRFEPRHVILGCLVACVAQYGLTAWVRDPAWLYLVMLLHGLTFGLYYYMSVLWLGRAVPHEVRATAQALFHAIPFGVGGALSAAICGYLFEAGSGPLMYGVATAASVVTLVAAVPLLRPAPPLPSEAPRDPPSPSS